MPEPELGADPEDDPDPEDEPEPERVPTPPPRKQRKSGGKRAAKSWSQPAERVHADDEEDFEGERPCHVYTSFSYKTYHVFLKSDHFSKK